MTLSVLSASTEQQILNRSVDNALPFLGQTYFQEAGKMKKPRILLLAALLLLTLGGCGSDSSGAASRQESSASASSAAESSEAAVSDVVSAAVSGSESDKTSSVESSREASGETGTYQMISQQEAAELLRTKSGYVLLDVRTTDEFAQGHIPGAVCIPNETITDRPPAQLPDFSRMILVYCRSGRRSKEAASKLAGMGYTHVLEFGGIIDWQGEVVTDS